MNAIQTKVHLIGQLNYRTGLNNKELANKRRSFELLAKGVFRLHTGDDIWEISLHSLVLPANMVERAEKYLSNQREVAVLGNCIHRTYTNNKGEKVVGSEIHVSELLLLYYPWHKCNRC